MTTILKGKIVMNTSMIGILCNDDSNFYKLGMKDLASQVIDEDLILFTIQNNQGIVHKIVERKRQPFIGIVSKITCKNIYIHLPLLNPCSSIACPLRSPGPSKDIKIGDNILGWIDIDKCEIIDFGLKDKDLIERYHNELLKTNISNLSLESKNISNHPTKDLTHLKTFHIDPSGCIDIDDLMSVDLSMNKVYIHIIDISKYISIGSKEDQIGLIYGNTWYFPEFTLHLYPNASGFYGRPLFCITMEITFDKDILSNVELYKSLVDLKFNFTYSEVQEIFDGKDHPLKKELDWSLDRIRQIYLPHESTMRRLYWRFEENKIQMEYESELLAHRYINAWMVFYNSWMGENIRINGQLLPQRHHPETNIRPILSETFNIPKEVQHILQVKQMRQAEYMNKAGHYGLNRNFYTHATSPLRRYFDRWIQYMYSYDFWIEGKELLEHLNRMERISERVSDWYHKQILLKYVEQNKDKLWEAYAVKIHPKGMEWYIYDIQEFLYQAKEDRFVVLGEKVNLKLQVDRRNIPKLQIL
jgi:hypothetical protein